MLRGLYTASTVLEQNTKSIDVMSNNLANINTTGYKKDIPEYEEFNSMLLSKINASTTYLNRGALDVKVEQEGDIYKLTTNTGFFRVGARGGASNNRTVEFRKTGDGSLKTFYRNGYHDIIEDAGYNVLGQKGPINVGDKAFEIDKQGNVLVDGKIVDSMVFAEPDNTIGTYSGGVMFRRTVTDYEQGAFKETSNAFDLALSGRGFFTIKTEAGTRYTRSGDFKLGPGNELLTNAGDAVLGLEGPIVLKDGAFAVNQFGEIIEGGLIVDKLAIVNPQNIQRMQKVGGDLFKFQGGEEAMQTQAFTGQVVQGVLEASNVNSLTEMIQIMETYRAYEGAQRIVRSIDDTIEKAISVGNV